MDNFDNFYKNDNDKNETKEKKVDYPQNNNYSEPPRVIFQRVAPSEPQDEQPEKTKKLKKQNILLLVVSIILVVSFIANIVVMASFKSEIATHFANRMAYQAQGEYQLAIDDVLSGTSIVDDVTTSAVNQATAQILTDIGRTVADKCLNSVVVINCSAQGQSSSTASGFLISEGTTRYVLTNSHVVTYKSTVNFGGILGGTTTTSKPYTTIKCKFYDSETSYGLTLVDYDDERDLALLRFSTISPNSSQHPAIKLAYSNTLNYGEQIVLIGNPEGIGIAVSSGAVSIPQVSVPNWGTSTFVMTDAAVNPGNSGGPMLDRNGICVGVVESKLVASNIDNMGFAVDIDTVWTYLLEKEAQLGISIGYKIG